MTERLWYPVSVPIRKIIAEIEQLRKKMEENQRQLGTLQKKITLLEGQSDTELLRRKGKPAQRAKG